MSIATHKLPVAATEAWSFTADSGEFLNVAIMDGPGEGKILWQFSSNDSEPRIACGAPQGIYTAFAALLEQAVRNNWTIRHLPVEARS